MSPELTGVGYIIGPRISGYLFAGGVHLVLRAHPGDQALRRRVHDDHPARDKLIADMDAMTVRSNYIYYIGAGAVTAAGLISLARSLPTILSALVGGFRSATADAAASERRRRDAHRTRPADHDRARRLAGARHPR